MALSFEGSAVPAPAYAHLLRALIMGFEFGQFGGRQVIAVQEALGPSA